MAAIYYDIMCVVPLNIPHFLDQEHELESTKEHLVRLLLIMVTLRKVLWP